MDKLKILKLRLGIMTDKRDLYLQAILNGVESELKNVHGIKLDNTDELNIFIVDYAEFRYSNRGELGKMPDHLRFRLQNIYINKRN